MRHKMSAQSLARHVHLGLSMCMVEAKREVYCLGVYYVEY